MKNSIVDLRNHLFEVIERLKDPCPKNPIDCETAETICLVAKRLIETAEVEIKFRDLIGNHKDPSEFLKLPGMKPESSGPPATDHPDGSASLSDARGITGT